MQSSSPLLYGCEAWVTCCRHLKSLERFHQRRLRKILRTYREARRTNTSTVAEAGFTNSGTIFTGLDTVDTQLSTPKTRALLPA